MDIFDIFYNNRNEEQAEPMVGDFIKNNSNLVSEKEVSIQTKKFPFLS